MTNAPSFKSPVAPGYIVAALSACGHEGDLVDFLKIFPEKLGDNPRMASAKLTIKLAALAQWHDSKNVRDLARTALGGVLTLRPALKTLALVSTVEDELDSSATGALRAEQMKILATIVRSGSPQAGSVMRRIHFLAEEGLHDNSPRVRTAACGVLDVTSGLVGVSIGADLVRAVAEIAVDGTAEEEERTIAGNMLEALLQKAPRRGRAALGVLAPDAWQGNILALVDRLHALDLVVQKGEDLRGKDYQEILDIAFDKVSFPAPSGFERTNVRRNAYFLLESTIHRGKEAVSSAHVERLAALCLSGDVSCADLARTCLICALRAVPDAAPRAFEIVKEGLAATQASVRVDSLTTLADLARGAQASLFDTAASLFDTALVKTITAFALSEAATKGERQAARGALQALLQHEPSYLSSVMSQLRAAFPFGEGKVGGLIYETFGTVREVCPEAAADPLFVPDVVHMALYELSSKNRYDARQAVKGVLKDSPRSAVSFLRAARIAYERTQNAYVRSAALLMMELAAKTDPITHDCKVAGMFLASLNDEDAEARIAALQGVAHVLKGGADLIKTGDARNVATLALSDPDERVRVAAFKVMNEMKETPRFITGRYVGALAKGAALDLSEKVRDLAAETLKAVLSYADFGSERRYRLFIKTAYQAAIPALSGKGAARCEAALNLFYQPNFIEGLGRPSAQHLFAAVEARLGQEKVPVLIRSRLGLVRDRLTAAHPHLLERQEAGLPTLARVNQRLRQSKVVRSADC